MNAQTRHYSGSYRSRIDIARSYEKGEAVMKTFKLNFRQQRKAKSGGISGHHRELWSALLYLLPLEMDRIAKEQPEEAKLLANNGNYCLFTNREQLRKMMGRRSSGSQVEPVVCIRTVSNLINRLIECKLILLKIRYDVFGQANPRGKGNFKLFLNPDFIVEYGVQSSENLEDLLDFGEAQTDSNKEDLGNVLQPTSIFLDRTINHKNSLEAVNKADLAEAKELCKENKGESKESCEFSRKSTNDSISDYQKNFTYHAKEEKKTFYAKQIWAAARAKFYQNREFSPGTQELVLDMLQDHYSLIEDQLQNYRAKLIQDYTKKEAFQALNDKMKVTRLKWIAQRLFNPTKAAFSVCMNAIRIQLNNSRKNGYEVYQPLPYFSNDYGYAKALKYARDDFKKSQQFKHKKTKLGQQYKAKHLRDKFIAGIYDTCNREGMHRALMHFDQASKIYRKCLDELASLKDIEKQEYIIQFKELATCILSQQQQNPTIAESIIKVTKPKTKPKKKHIEEAPKRLVQSFRERKYQEQQELQRKEQDLEERNKALAYQKQQAIIQQLLQDSSFVQQVKLQLQQMNRTSYDRDLSFEENMKKRSVRALVSTIVLQLRPDLF